MFASLAAMMPPASYSSSAPAISVRSSASQPSGPRPLWPGICSRETSDAAYSLTNSAMGAALIQTVSAQPSPSAQAVQVPPISSGTSTPWAARS